jgi:hypothetical protein
MKKKSRKRNPSIKKKSRKRNPSIKRRCRKYDKEGFLDFINKYTPESVKSIGSKIKESVKSIGSKIYKYTPASIKNVVSKIGSKIYEYTPERIKKLFSKRRRNPYNYLPTDAINKIFKDYFINDCNFNQGNIKNYLFTESRGLIDGKTIRTDDNEKKEILRILNKNLNNHKDEILKAYFILRSLKNLIKHDVTKEDYIKILILLSFNEEITIENLTEVFEINKTDNMYNYRDKYFCLFEDIPLLNPDIPVRDLVIINSTKKNTIETKPDFFYFIPVRDLDSTTKPNFFYKNINCENLSFYGFSCVKTIEDGFLEYTRIENVTFDNFNNLQIVGNRWMRHCRSLVSPKFIGLEKLQKVGNEWMTFCRSLVSLNFTGLENLKEVGDNWMRDCRSLVSPNFTDLENLQKVGYGWMCDCNSLVSLNFKGLKNLKEVDHDWMYYCPSLVSLNFTDLEKLQKVGRYWMRDCPSLVSPDFKGLKNLKEVGDNWMYGCSSLESPNFTGLEKLKEVGDAWMERCPRTLNSYRVNTSFHAEKIGDKFQLVAN